jgi:sirohydrochlorin ferrochelatase
MIKKFGIVGAAIGALILTASLALAAITFHSGPTVTFSGASATATFNVSGLGNDPAQATLAVDGTARYVCQNKGHNVAPGQPTGGASGSTTAPLTKSEKNGRSTVTVTATLVAPTTPTPQEIGCPNPPGNWTVVLVSLTVTSATLTIEQPIGTIIYGPTTFFP